MEGATPPQACGEGDFWSQWRLLRGAVVTVPKGWGRPNTQRLLILLEALNRAPACVDVMRTLFLLQILSAPRICTGGGEARGAT